MSKEQPTTDNKQRTIINVLFVCMGNICRSPMAEAVFRHLVAQAGLTDRFRIESVGTDSYHLGEHAHPGTQRVLAEHGISCDSRSQPVTRANLAEANYIVVMDRYNLADVQSMAPRASLDGRLYLLLNFAENQQLQDVPDPYYTGNFEQVYELVKAGCQGLLAYIRQEWEL